MRYLPPFGLLPRDAVEPREGHNSFFPDTYHVEAVPIPEEQLDLALEASASLRLFDTFTPDQVRVLVPVPQALYEPRLLVREELDPAFDRAIARFGARRNRWLARRDDLLTRRGVLGHALTGGPRPPLRSRRTPDEPPGAGPAILVGALPPLRLRDGARLRLDVDGTTFEISFDAESVADLGQITVEELNNLLILAAAPVHADTDPETGRLRLITLAVGETVTLTALAADPTSAHVRLGLSIDTPARGSSDPTDPIDPEDPELQTAEELHGVELRAGEGDRAGSPGGAGPVCGDRRGSG